MKVLVLGHRGMLGHVVAQFLREKQLDVQTSEERYTARPNDPLMRAIESSEATWIVNCIGLIKQKSADASALIETNSLLPAHIKATLRSGQRLLQPSTDCVYSGRSGSYRSDARKDAEDIYGFSKLLGEGVAEKGKCQIIRTSIIGPELSTANGLMAWFLSQKGPVNGYTNHFWNGITTLEWAKLCAEIITEKFDPPRAILQVGSPEMVSKQELLNLVAEIWPHLITIKPVEAPERVDRTLQPDLVRPPLRHQIAELRQFVA